MAQSGQAAIRWGYHPRSYSRYLGHLPDETVEAMLSELSIFRRSAE
jgi:hypothetical protein